MTREEHMEIFNEMLRTPEEKRFAMINSGMFNSIIQGYLVATLEQMGFDEDKIKECAYVLCHNVLDTLSAEDAKNKKIF